MPIFFQFRATNLLAIESEINQLFESPDRIFLGVFLELRGISTPVVHVPIIQFLNCKIELKMTIIESTEFARIPENRSELFQKSAQITNCLRHSSL